MAFSVSVNHKTVWGNMKVHILSCVADATTQNIATGMDVVYGHALSPISMTSSAKWAAYPNKGSASTTLAGYVGVTGVTSGDEFFLTVYGR
jgi:hypothetical protein